MVTYELKKDAKLTDSERESLKKVNSVPVIYDDDSPEMTPRFLSLAVSDSLK